MMRTIISTLLTSVFLFSSVEPSSHGSGSSEDSSDMLHTVRSLPLGRGEKLVVDEFKQLVLTRANYADKAVRPFKNSLGTRFVEYQILELQEPPYGIVYVPKIVDPEKWALDIYEYGEIYMNDWIHGRAVSVCQQYTADEEERRAQVQLHPKDALRQSLQAHSDFLKKRKRGRDGH